MVDLEPLSIFSWSIWTMPISVRPTTQRRLTSRAKCIPVGMGSNTAGAFHWSISNCMSHGWEKQMTSIWVPIFIGSFPLVPVVTVSRSTEEFRWHELCFQTHRVSRLPKWLGWLGDEIGILWALNVWKTGPRQLRLSSSSWGYPQFSSISIDGILINHPWLGTPIDGPPQVAAATGDDPSFVVFGNYDEAPRPLSLWRESEGYSESPSFNPNSSTWAENPAVGFPARCSVASAFLAAQVSEFVSGSHGRWWRKDMHRRASPMKTFSLPRWWICSGGDGSSTGSRLGSIWDEFRGRSGPLWMELGDIHTISFYLTFFCTP